MGSRKGWQRLGRVIEPVEGIEWLASAGPAAGVLRPDGHRVDVYVAGRDERNRSSIGRVVLDLRDPQRLVEISPEPLLSVGELGAFDENGVSYPCLVEHEGTLHLYYVGWMPTVLTPFQVHLGLAVLDEHGRFQRVSRAPILERNDEDYLAIGSSYVLVENGRWRLWYTCFLGWGTSPDGPPHTYVIKYAESPDGRHWTRRNRVCIPLQHEGEHSISRPSVLKMGSLYHMWYCYRGDEYRIGYATSRDGLAWERKDDRVGLEPVADGWESKAVAYPHVFAAGEDLYMLYCGNGYGRTGVGLATRRASDFSGG